MTGKISVYVVDYNRKFLVLQWKDPATGERKSKSSKCTTRREAERAAADLEKRLNSLTPNGDGLYPWDEFLDLYSSEHLESLADSSRLRAETGLNRFTELMKPAVIRSVTTPMLSQYAATMRDLGRAEQTILTNFGIIRTALRWAKDNGYSSEIPRFPRITRTKKNRSKGRPLTFWEVARMLRAVPSVVGDDAAPSWSRLIKGLFVSGLRIEEALSLTWQQDGTFEKALWVDTSGRFPLLGTAGESEKGRKDRLLPITPDFARFLLRTPADQRKGLVFPLDKRRHKSARNMDHTSKVISAIGQASGVVVNSSGKFASAHDFRRSFGLRWAHKTFPAELQELMRHEDIDTTMKFYALMDATNFAARLWANDPRSQQKTTPSTTPDKKH